jgi:hypothetical protein
MEIYEHEPRTLNSPGTVRSANANFNFYYPIKRQLYFTLSIFSIILSGVRLSPLGTAPTTGLLYQSQMIDDGDPRMKIGRRN